MRPVRQALISVSDKTGIVELAQALHALGIQLLSTGGTARLLADAGLPVTEVSAHTGFPEMLDGRVKTLHPAIHGGLLARRDLPDHMAALEAHAISTIDLLVVNLYPFEATVSRPDCTLEDAIENIDIGGPAMVRSAAKNWRDVGVLTDSSQYPQVLSELRGSGALSDATRFALSVAAFNRISNYDAAISDYLSRIQPDGSHAPLALRQTVASSKFRTCATARILTSRQRSTAISTPHRGRLSPHVRSRARNSPTTTSPMPTQPGSASSRLTAPPA